MNRYIPENAETRNFPGAAIVAYCYDTGRGAAFLAYKGRQSKPKQHAAFSTVEGRDRALASLVEQHESMEAWKRERKEAQHGLEVGDIVCSVWGYEQTNVTFFEVVRVPSGRSATLRELEAERVEDAPHSMTGTATPKPGQYAQGAKDQTRRATGLHKLSGLKSWHGDAQKWSGKPCRVTWYG